ncbi:MAG: hypothetical protein ACI3ZD_10375 [Prevotella sp.]
MIPYHVFLLGNPLDSAEPKKAYAKCVTVDNVSHEQFVRNVAEYSGIHSRGNKKNWKSIVLYVIRVIELILTGAAGGAVTTLL